MLSAQLLDEHVQDSSYDVAFAEQHTIATSKGEFMFKAVEQIRALRKLVALLHRDLGAEEVQTFKMPHWVGYVPVGSALTGDIDIPYVSDIEIPIPVLHYFADQPFAISFGNTTNYQCNMFSTMMANDFVERTSALITEADKMVRKLFNNDAFRRVAFCNTGACQYPPLFQNYLDETDPKSFEYADARKKAGGDMGPLNIKLRNWCSMRWHAAQSLMGLEFQLVTLNPALGHAEQLADDVIGPPLFDRLAYLLFMSPSEKTQYLKSQDDLISAKQTNPVLAKRAIETFNAELSRLDAQQDTAKKDYATKEADRVLPSMQEDLKKYQKKVCSDVRAGEGSAESTYMAVLNHEFMGGFNYCAGLKPDELSRAGLPCPLRESFLSCKMSQESEHWKLKKELPGFLYQVGMAGLDALFVYSVASGGIARLFTVRGAITGGVVGLGFTYGNYKLSEWLAHYNEGAWKEYHAGSAAAALEGVDSYANALTAIAASQPRAKVSDFVIGFVMGAMFSGKPEGEVKGSSRGGGAKPKGTPKEVFEEVAKKVADFSETEGGGGVRFSARTLSELKDWMMKKTADNPDFAQELLKNMGEHLNALSDADYAKLFSGPEGMFKASQVRRAMAVRLRQASLRLGKFLSDIKSDLSLKKLRNAKLTEAETALSDVGVQGLDIAKAADSLGPRELASLADAAEDAAKEIPGEKPGGRTSRLAEFLRKLCGLAVWCPGLQSLKGCSL
jgi:hypothetical protein